MEGFLLIDKPKGWTSFDVVKKIRGLAGVRKVGHSGTLDPLATGL
ncbi:MAG: tRNA pseudouridine(55) synthase, partial [Patescibacteria group bacterium]